MRVVDISAGWTCGQYPIVCVVRVLIVLCLVSVVGWRSIRIVRHSATAGNLTGTGCCCVLLGLLLPGVPLLTASLLSDRHNIRHGHDVFDLLVECGVNYREPILMILIAGQATLIAFCSLAANRNEPGMWASVSVLLVTAAIPLVVQLMSLSGSPLFVHGRFPYVIEYGSALVLIAFGGAMQFYGCWSMRSQQSTIKREL